MRRTGGRDEINVFKFIKSSWGKGEEDKLSRYQTTYNHVRNYISVGVAGLGQHSNFSRDLRAQISTS